MNTTYNKNIFKNKSFLRIQNDALIKKEILQFLREPSQWIHLLIMVLLILIFSLSLMNYKIFTDQPFLQSVSYIIIYLFTAFLISALSVRFAYPIIGLEAENFWRIKSAPIIMAKFFNIKLFFILIPVLFLSLVLSVFTSWQFRSIHFIFGVLNFSLICLTIVTVSMNISAGALFSTYKEKNPIRIASTQGASLTFLVSLFFLTIVSVIIFLMLLQFYEYSKLQINFSYEKIMTPVLLISIISGIIWGVCYFLGIKSLQRDYY